MGGRAACLLSPVFTGRRCHQFVLASCAQALVNEAFTFREVQSREMELGHLSECLLPLSIGAVYVNTGTQVVLSQSNTSYKVMNVKSNCICHMRRIQLTVKCLLTSP